MSVLKRPRCGKWMAEAQEFCGEAEGHRSRCRTPEAVAARNLRTAAYNTQRASERYKLLDAYKVALGCVDCGYREHPRALDLDHTNPSNKVDDVSRLIKFASWDRVMAEVEKCVVRCANCHRVKTFRTGE